MMKVLDRYILRTFLVSLAIAMATMMGISLVLDLFFNNVSQVWRSSPTGQAEGFWTIVGNVADYSFYRIFMYFQLLAAPALQVAAAAAMVRLNRTRELVGIKAAGISLYRVLWPMILVALVIDGLYVVNQEAIIPSVGVELSRGLDDVSRPKEFTVDFVRDQHKHILYAPRFDPISQQILSSTYTVTDPDVKAPADKAWSRKGLVRIWLRDEDLNPAGTIEAESGRWDPQRGGWRLTSGILRPARVVPTSTPGGPSWVEHVEDSPPGKPYDFFATNVGPREIARHRLSDFHRFMSYSELTDLIDEPMRGNRRQLQVSLHQHITQPILNILLILLGLPFIAGRDDRNYFTNIGIAAALSIGVFGLNFATTALGNSNNMTPLLAAWLPVFVLLPASVISMESLRT
jgi:lipopolysaccharide export system permease protein